MAKTEIKNKVLFFPDKEISNKGNENIFIEIDKKTSIEKIYNFDAKLRIRIRWANNVLNFNLGERVELAKWVLEAQRCKVGTTHGKKKITAKDINAKIDDAAKKIDSIFENFENQNLVPTVDDFRNKYNKVDTDSKDAEIIIKTFFDYYDIFVAEQSTQNNWKYATLQKFTTVKNHLLDFDKNLTFDYLTKDGLNKYVAKLQKKDLQNTTILKQIKFLKWFLRWATGEGHNTNLAFTTYSPKMDTAEKKVIFLDWTELMTVYNFDFSTATKTLPDGTIINLEDDSIKALERVRDVFCFCCFTSLRYSDVENLKRTDIKADVMTVTTIKTTDTLTIELNNYSRAILAKYADEVYPNNKALPVISNQKMNDHLKTVGDLCGLDTPITITYYKGSKRFDEVYPKYELLSTHCGRRTFICCALTLGIAPNTVMKWTGHSDYKSMKPYIDIADAEKKKSMELFNR